MTNRTPVPTRTAAYLWFFAAAGMAVSAVLRYRSGQSAWLQVGTAVLMLAVGVRFLLRSRAAGG